MIVKPGSTDVTTYFHLRLAADGTDATGLTITAMDLQYVRSGEAPAAKVDATALAATNSAHGDNQAIEIDATDQPGVYRVDWPDAAFAASAREVILTVKCATVFTESLRVQLQQVHADVTHWLGTAAATPTVAGVPEVDLTHIGGSAVTAASGIPEVKVASIANDAITAAAIATDAIGAAELADGAITAATFAAGAIDATAIAAGAIGASEIADGAIDAATFAAGAITAAAIATDAIDADALAADAVTEIQSGLATAAALDTVDNFLDTEVAAIKAKTDNLPADPADASDVAAGIAGLDAKLDTIDNFLDTEIAAIKAVTDLFTAAQSEPTGVPAANATPMAKIAWIAMLARNKITQTATTQLVLADDGSTTVGTSTVSDDGVTATRGEFA
jgi:hypothetical protein